MNMINERLTIAENDFAEPTKIRVRARAIARA